MPEHSEDESKTVLIVGDDVGSILRLRELLTRQGFSVLQAPSMQEALDVIAAGHAELVVLDTGSYITLQQRADRLTAINRLTRVIGASFDLSEVYQAFAAEVGQLVHYDQIGLVLRGDSGHGMKMLKLHTDQSITGEPACACALGGGRH